MHIDKKSPIPVYYQLINIIRQKISTGEYGEGSIIPSERELCDTLRISRMTVRQALNHLVNEGVLFREKGKGTFVSKAKITQRNIMSFSEVVKQRGMVPSTKILFFNKENAGDDIVSALGLKSGEMVYILKRLRLADNIPVGIEEDFIPESYFPQLEKLDLTGSLYKIIKDEYGFNISYVDSIIESAKPSKEEREILNIHGAISVLKVSGINYSENNQKLFFERSSYRSDEYKFSVRIRVNEVMP